MKKSIIWAIAVSMVVAAFWVFTPSSNGVSKLAQANIEALADNPPVGWIADGPNGTGECCLNGYKIWSTEGWPWQTEKEFKDCWCRDKTGYSPEACGCN